MRRKPKTYTIKTIADLAALPPSSLRRCLDEIERVLKFQRNIARALGSHAEIEAIRWTDDGVDRITKAVVNDKDGQELLSVEMKEPPND